MPEGPEVWILSKAINLYYATNRENQTTLSYGKHLFILDKKENWSFGLSGTVRINEAITKLPSGWLHGEITTYKEFDTEIQKLGIDFMTATEAEISQEIDKWIKSKKKLAGLMIDQTKISGIGVAWGSEILFRAELRPDMRACDQALGKLASSILYIREEIKNIYEKQLKDKHREALQEFINEWFENLYEIREMSVYKKGSKLEVLGRSWWV
jgi:formamidopyrimidine-DNA glycosylase